MGGKLSHLTRGGLQVTPKQGKHCYTLKAVLNLHGISRRRSSEEAPVMGVERRAEPI